MGIQSAAGMLGKASGSGYAVGAFNVTNLVQLEAVVQAAADRQAPVIVQTSVAPSRFLGVDVLVAVCRALAARTAVPLCLHLDHCTEVDYCIACAAAGYTNVMIDASKLDFEENVRQTREVCQHAHRLAGVSVEGELGIVAGVEDSSEAADDESLLCDPQSAVEFVRRTGVDSFAPAIGTAHGVYKTADPKVDFERLGRIREALRANGLQVPLVIHGGTGLPERTTRRLVELGGAKLNVSTELKHTLIDATFDYIQAHRQEYDPGRIDKAVREAIRKTVQGWIDLLGCAGKA